MNKENISIPLVKQPTPYSPSLATYKFDNNSSPNYETSKPAATLSIGNPPYPGKCGS